MPEQFYADIHCHSALKPFGKSYPWNKNTRRRWLKRSIWHKRRHGIIREFINERLTITRFTQADFTTLSEGNVKLIFASLSPLEKGFFVTKVGKGPLVDTIVDWVTGIGRRKVNFVQRNKNYFKELQREYKFYLQLNGKRLNIKKQTWSYKLVNNYEEIQQNLEDNIISVIVSIEGAHVFNEDNTRPPTQTEVFANIDKVLSWEYKPLFISATHHFYNHICGHAYSLNSTLKKVLDQDEGVNTGFTELGREAIMKLMDNRVLVDIKHMSRMSRREFYEMAKTSEYQNLPIIASHTSVNGYPTVFSDDKLAEEHGLFSGVDINLFDDEILIIGKSKGLIGIQLDERRVASKKEIEKAKKAKSRQKQLELFAGLVWNQVLHIATVLDMAGENAWDCVCIGSDYDGIVDPMDGYWTAAEYSLLYTYMLKHAQKYISHAGNRFQNTGNDLPSSEIVDRLFSKNVMRFLERNY